MFDTLAAAAHDLGPHVMPVQCDVSDPGSVAMAVSQIVDGFGSITALVNNAGSIAPVGLFSETDVGDWLRLQEINLGGVVLMSRAVLPGMIARGRGVIINLSSGSAHLAVNGWSAYFTSKAAVDMFTRCLHVETRTSGVRVHSFIPGVVDTELLDSAQNGFDNEISRLDPAVKLTPDLPARCIAWLIDEGADLAGSVSQTIRDPDLRARVGLLERPQW